MSRGKNRRSHRFGPREGVSIEGLQRAACRYFLSEWNPENGLLRDSTHAGAPCSIAVLGFGLSVYPVAVEHGLLNRVEAARRAHRLLRFLADAPQSPARNASGYRGLFYHFLDMDTGRRARRSELSTMDSAILFAGALTAAAYFDAGDALEGEIRDLAELLYQRADWPWALNGGATLSHGWRPEHGFLRYRWEGYDEAGLLYVLALGSPTRPVAPRSYRAWASGFRWKHLYGYEHVYAGPLFIHQMAQCWIDLRGIHDATMREADIDYFENSRRAVMIQREYARRNPKAFRGYGEHCWGITASDGPGDVRRRVDGRLRRFWGYRARGAPFGPDDGTVSPWVALAALPYQEDLVLEMLDHVLAEYPDIEGRYGLLCSFNPTYPAAGSSVWVSGIHLGLDLGPIVMMGANHRSELIWGLTRRCPHIVRGLRRAGFRGGWLDDM